MSWIFLALGAASTLGVVQILDKLVLFRYVRSPFSLPFWVGLVQSAFGLTLILFLPWPETVSFSSIVWGFLSGTCLGLSAVFLLRVLYSQEVSRTIPIFSTFPIFAALIGVFFLNETLSPYHWVAILATVTGAALLSLRQNQKYRHLFLHRSFFLLMLASLLSAGNYVTSKIALEGLPFLNLYGLHTLATGIVILLPCLRSAPLRECRNLLRQRSPALIITGLNQWIIGTSALLLSLWALSLGPVALVSTIVGTRSFFIVLFSTVITLRFSASLDEQISPGIVVIKFVATALIVAGVATITLV